VNHGGEEALPTSSDSLAYTDARAMYNSAHENALESDTTGAMTFSRADRQPSNRPDLHRAADRLRPHSTQASDAEVASMSPVAAICYVNSSSHRIHIQFTDPKLPELASFAAASTLPSLATPLFSAPPTAKSREHAASKHVKESFNCSVKK